MSLERIIEAIALALFFIGALALEIYLSLMTYPGPIL
jgi:hypothetical protein